jgi:DNA-binding NarL/FixJ family response regulator
MTTVTVTARPRRSDPGFAALAVKPPSARESQVLRLMSYGLGNRQIARTLRVSDHTVKTFVSRMLAKFEAANRAALIANGFARGVLAPRPLHPGVIAPPIDGHLAVVLLRIAQGKTNREIAAELGIEEHRAVRGLLGFLGVTGRDGAVRIGVEAGYLAPSPDGSRLVLAPPVAGGAL